ncbi:MAG: hypothetical protein DMF68_05365 [Acidobacteria bacterium]|nr:MAG: hypothetical protein DMF68_05365 [Acidobacteriota bacterium]
MTIEAGTRIGRYEIRRPLGAGGMGEVYLALDMKLDRTVALKLLPAEVVSDQKRMQRFVQEARAASSLNHPNIITIHEIEDTASPPFIATEFIDGETLRARLARPLKLTEALEIITQVASALSAAHAAGIVHRDIKPENIMIRPDGYVKVLDFGLAKLTEPRGAAEIDTEAATRALIQTDPGAVMGTISYMSPEQASGHEVDARTDIWSLGVVLYEMVTGRVPFEGSTPSHVIVTILEKEPLPLSAYVEGVPEALEWIVTEALTKDREERTQTARELLKKLQRLKQRVDADAEVERSVSPERLSSTSGGGAGGSMVSGTSQQSVQPALAATESATTRTGEVAAAATNVSSAEYVVNQIKSHKKSVLLIVALLVLGGVGFALYKLLGQHQSKQVVSLEAAKITRLTTSGKASNVAISPDGKYVVHVQDDGGQRSLWMRQTATQSNVQIVAPAAVSFDALAFSPDGNFVYYSVSGQSYPQRVLFQIPTLGGSPKKILEDLDADHISFSPDGKQFAFIRTASGKESSVMIADADGANVRKIVSVKNPPESLGSPAWSPDGRRIAYDVLNYDSNDETLYEAQVADGSTKPLTAQRWFRIAYGTAWMSDGNSLLMLAAAEQKFVFQIWQLSYPEGEAHRLTNDLDNYTAMSLTADSKTLAVVKQVTQANIWIAPNNDVSRARPVTSGSGKADRYVAWTPDGGRIVYSSNASGNDDIWIVNADGGNQKQLTSNARVNRLPAVSPDGRFIVFLSDRSGTPHIWRMNLDGSDQRQLTNGALGEQTPQFSPDGRWIVYSTAHGNRRTAWKIISDGSGAPVQFSGKVSSSPTVSPDGKSVAYFYKETDNAPFRIAIAALEGGEPFKTFALPPTFDAPLRWTPDGRAVAYIDTRNAFSNIVAQPIDGGAVKQLTNFTSDRIFWFDFSHDGKQLALSRGTQTSDVVLIKDFR